MRGETKCDGMGEGGGGVWVEVWNTQRVRTEAGLHVSVLGLSFAGGRGASGQLGPQPASRRPASRADQTRWGLGSAETALSPNPAVVQTRSSAAEAPPGPERASLLYSGSPRVLAGWCTHTRTANTRACPRAHCLTCARVHEGAHTHTHMLMHALNHDTLGCHGAHPAAPVQSWCDTTQAPSSDTGTPGLARSRQHLLPWTLSAS